ncbi:ParB/RepB/Spo0J family partition protein [Sphingopyxis sp.]|jgi:ParB family chromosome partitioning protein|uniref:ParB/RepB/Spo0J family partition protein n=1 Tax=Sphingopyxis sp. TaxID=1908224 RepID=UPI003F6F51C7
MSSRTFTHAELHKSDLNVRTNAEDAEATGALEASIARVGLMLPLLVHPAAPDAPTPWGVLAGGRRLRAIGRLIDAGRLPADWPIAATVVDGLPNAEITEMSLGENLLRRDLRPYEVHAAIAHAVAQGDSVETIAENLGQEKDWVRRQLRLGKLAAPIFAAYAAGDLSFEQASAYAATEDSVLQLSVWEALRHEHSYHHNGARIRAALKVGDREASRLLLFVGEAIYVGAGGMIEPDLFVDGRDTRVRITDEQLLRRLAEERFAVERERIRADVKIPDLRFTAQPPQFSGRTDEALEIIPNGGKLAAHRYPADAIVATIDVDDHGAPFTRFWWASRAAKGAAEKPGTRSAADPVNTAVNAPRAGEAFAMPDSAYAANGRAIARDQYGLTADGLQLIRSLRRTLLRRLLIEQGGSVANDYLVWSQARALLSHALPAQTGARAIVGEWHDGADRAPPGLFEGFQGDVAAAGDWHAWVDMLKAQTFMTEGDPGKSLSAYLELDQASKDRTAAIVAGTALIRSADTPGWRCAAHDVLARACGVDALKLRSWWTPSAKWLGLFGRMFRLGITQAFVDAATHAGFVRLRDSDVTTAAAIALDPGNHNDPAVRARAARWLPDLVAFGPDDPVEPQGHPIDDAVIDPPADEARVKVKKSLRIKAAQLRERQPSEPVE